MSKINLKYPALIGVVFFLGIKKNMGVFVSLRWFYNEEIKPS